jgi:phosphatidylglycerophosphate synthase
VSRQSRRNPTTSVQSGLRNALLALTGVLAVLDATVGVGLPGWAAGLACGATLSLAASACAARGRVEVLGPADVVTLTRATLACAVSALVADSFVGEPAGRTLVVLAAVALALDAVDGRVARTTHTASAFGARLDGEADAFLILVLSVYVARFAGTWVFALGAVRYVFAMAGWMLPWLRAEVPPRFWRKVVAATAGISLAWGASGVGSDAISVSALAVAGLLLAESFGRDVWWLWCHRPIEVAPRAEVRTH